MKLSNLLKTLFYGSCTLFLFACSPSAPPPQQEWQEEELELLQRKALMSYKSIKTDAEAYPERYSKNYRHSQEVHHLIQQMDSLLPSMNKVAFKQAFLQLKQSINKSKLYHGSWIFDLIKNRYRHLEAPDFNQPDRLRWQLLSFEEELQNYLYIHLDDEHYILSSVRPLVLNDTAICLISFDTNTVQNIHIWDADQSEDLYFDQPNDSIIQSIELKNGRGIVKNPEQFPEGYQGYFRLKTKHGDVHNYWLGSRRELDSLR